MNGHLLTSAPMTYSLTRWLCSLLILGILTLDAAPHVHIPGDDAAQAECSICHGGAQAKAAPPASDFEHLAGRPVQTASTDEVAVVLPRQYTTAPIRAPPVALQLITT